MSNKEDKINFVSNKSFELAVKKAKRKQIARNFLIGIISSVIILCAVYAGSSYILKKRLEDDYLDIMFSQVKGANIGWTRAVNSYSFLNARTHITIEKTLGDRNIIWNSLEREVTLTSKKDISMDTSKNTQYSETLKRQVSYNKYNGEREIQFYYPQGRNLPQELNLLEKFDENTLVEMALSFNHSYSLEDLEGILGSDNVNWLWVNTNPNQGYNSKTDSNKFLSGDAAIGFSIDSSGFNEAGQLFLDNLIYLSKEGDYKKATKKILLSLNENYHPNTSDIQVLGAVVTGTPQQLARFKDLDIIRASTLGATIDIY